MKKWLDAQYPEELPLTCLLEMVISKVISAVITLLITISKRLIF
jgi:hypothetical protein